MKKTIGPQKLLVVIAICVLAVIVVVAATLSPKNASDSKKQPGDVLVNSESVVSAESVEESIDSFESEESAEESVVESSEEIEGAEESIEETVSEDASVEESSDDDHKVLFDKPDQGSQPTYDQEGPYDNKNMRDTVVNVIGSNGQVCDTINVTLYGELNKKTYIEHMASIISPLAPEGLWVSGALAQAFTEGGAGTWGVYSMTNNCFGIRAGANWDGYVFARAPYSAVYDSYETAVRHGASDMFRAYKNKEESAADYINLITNGYSSAIGTASNREYLMALLNKGYGEAYMYSTWLQMINIFDLEQYDK